MRSLETRRSSWPLVTSRAFSRPTSTKARSTSLSTTGMPAAATTCAISPPMVPAPTTAALNTLDKGADPSGDPLGLLLARVPGARPEEAPQPVLAPPRDHVDVEVRHRLRDDVVDRVEDALGRHRVAHGHRQA